MNCPSCNHATVFEPIYKLNLCKNKSCILYLKDDVSKYQPQTPRSQTSESDLIDEIMNNFDFTRVLNVMRYLNWSWANGVNPDIRQLKEKAKDLLVQCITDGKTCKGLSTIQTAGFKAIYDYDENFLELLFVLEESSAE